MLLCTNLAHETPHQHETPCMCVRVEWVLGRAGAFVRAYLSEGRGQPPALVLRQLHLLAAPAQPLEHRKTFRTQGSKVSLCKIGLAPREIL